MVDIGQSVCCNIEALFRKVKNLITLTKNGAKLLSNRLIKTCQKTHHVGFAKVDADHLGNTTCLKRLCLITWEGLASLYDHHWTRRFGQVPSKVAPYVRSSRGFPVSH